jgi:hypothetical protein
MIKPRSSGLVQMKRPLEGITVPGDTMPRTLFDAGDQAWIPGNEIPPLVIPNTKQCFYMATVQSTATQYVKMVDASNNQMFLLQGASSSGTQSTPLGSGYFVAANPVDTYSLSIGAYQNSTLVWSRVLWSWINLFMGATVYCYNYVYVADDWTDNDNANCSVSIYWLMYAG